jgi:hypothetical protein
MHIRSFSALLLLTSMSAAVRAGEPISIFGLQLGRPFAMQECGWQKISKALNFYNASTATVCYRRTSDSEAGKGIDPAADTVFVRWPQGREPELVSGYSLVAGVIDGNLESVGFNTLGVRSQDRDMKALTDKFGAPATILTPTIQNGFGAAAQIVTAEWHIGNVSVYFNSAENGLSNGFIRVETEKSIASRNALMEKLHAAKQKL